MTFGNVGELAQMYPSYCPGGQDYLTAVPKLIRGCVNTVPQQPQRRSICSELGRQENSVIDLGLGRCLG